MSPRWVLLLSNLNGADCLSNALQDIPQCINCGVLFPFLSGQLCGRCNGAADKGAGQYCCLNLYVYIFNHLQAVMG